MKYSTLLFSALLFILPFSFVEGAVVYTATSQTGSRFNPTNGQAGGRSFDDVFVDVVGGENTIHIDSVTFGIRRGPTAGFLIPVDVEFFVGEFLAGGTLGAVTSLGVVSLDARASAGFVTDLITRTADINVSLNTETAGLGGLWVGMTFTGVNASSAQNGWRIVNAPTTGESNDLFGFESDTTLFGFFNFGGAPVANYYLEVDGTLSTIPEPSIGVSLGLGLLMLGLRRRR